MYKSSCAFVGQSSLKTCQMGELSAWLAVYENYPFKSIISRVPPSLEQGQLLLFPNIQYCIVQLLRAHPLLFTHAPLDPKWRETFLKDSEIMTTLPCISGLPWKTAPILLPPPCHQQRVAKTPFIVEMP